MKDVLDSKPGLFMRFPTTMWMLMGLVIFGSLTVYFVVVGDYFASTITAFMGMLYLSSFISWVAVAEKNIEDDEKGELNDV